MEHRSHERKITITRQDKAYFHSQTYINLEKTDVKRILFGRMYEIHDDILNYQINGSGWYFRGFIVGNSYCRLQTLERFIIHPSSRFNNDQKKAIFNTENENDKCFLWSY